MSSKATITEEKRVKPQKTEHKPKTKPKPKPKTVDALSNESGLAQLSEFCYEDELSVPYDTYRISEEGKLICVIRGEPEHGIRTAHFDITREAHLHAFAKCTRALFSKFPDNAEVIADALMDVMDPHLDEEELERLAYSEIDPGERFTKVTLEQDGITNHVLVSNVCSFYSVLDQFVAEPTLANRCALALLSEDLANAMIRFKREYAEELAKPAWLKLE
jgi:hypothetical protein